MTAYASPRILVVDDDLTVIASYRYVLEGDESSPASRGNSAHGSLEEELFSDSPNVTENCENWRIDFVDQGNDAVAAVRKAIADSDPFTVVFLDIRMPPGLDGYETAQAIRKIDQVVHIVFVSGYSDYTEEELTAVAGPKHRMSFLPKPVWPLQLKTKAHAVCTDAKLVELCSEALRQRRPEAVAGV